MKPVSCEASCDPCQRKAPRFSPCVAPTAHLCGLHSRSWMPQCGLLAATAFLSFVTCLYGQVCHLEFRFRSTILPRPRKNESRDSGWLISNFSRKSRCRTFRKRQPTAVCRERRAVAETTLGSKAEAQSTPPSANRPLWGEDLSLCWPEPKLANEGHGSSPPPEGRCVQTTGRPPPAQPALSALKSCRLFHWREAPWLRGEARPSQQLSVLNVTDALRFTVAMATHHSSFKTQVGQTRPRCTDPQQDTVMRGVRERRTCSHTNLLAFVPCL